MRRPGCDVDKMWVEVERRSPKQRATAVDERR